MLLVVCFFLFLSQRMNAQYYTAAQIQTINTNRAAYEGDMYLDTVNQQFFIGLTSGKLARIGDTIDELVDSLKRINDSIYLYQNSQILKVPATTAEKRDNHKLVKNISDLSDELVAGGGTSYLLSSNYVYEINGTILVDFPIQLNNAYIMGESSDEDILFNASGGTLFTGATGGTIRRINIFGNGQQVFDITGTGVENMIIFSSNIIGASSVGTLSTLGFVYFSTVQYVNNVDGLTTSSISSLFMTICSWTSSNTGTYLTLTGTFSDIQFSNIRVVVDAGETGIDVSSNPTINVSASLTGASFSGTGDHVNGYTIGSYTGYDFTNEWLVQGQGILTEMDDNATGNLYITTTATTNIAAANTPIKAAGTTTALNLLRTSSPTDNRLQYLGDKTRFFTYTASISVTASNNGRRFVFYIAKNGAILPESAQSRKIANGADRGSISVSGVTELQTNDYLEVWVENINDGTDITLESLNFLIR